MADAVVTDLDWDAKPSTFQYNRVGSMTRMTEILPASAARRTDVVRYDERQLPEEMQIVTFDRITLNDSLYVSYRYDTNGQRIRKQIRETAHGPDVVYERYVRDGDRLVGVFNENNSLKSWNIGGIVGLVGRADPNPWLQQPEHRYYVTDHLGSIRAVVNPSGTVIEGRDYYPYGLTMPGRFYVLSDTTREGFTGHELDRETGDYYAGARYYSPALARWFVPDPMAEEFPGWSPYNYSFNNPVAYNDPDGRNPIFRGGRLIVNVVRHGANRGAVAATFAGAVQDARTVMDSNASTGERIVAGLSLATEILSPVSARDVRALGEAAGVVNRADNAADATRGASRLSQDADFVVTPSGTAVPTSQSRMREGFDNAEFPSNPTSSPGVEHILPDGRSVRTMEPTSANPNRRASFENSSGGAPVDADGRTVQPPRGATRQERVEYVRERTHIDQNPQ